MNGTCGIHTIIYIPTSTNNIWSYYLCPPAIVRCRWKQTYELIDKLTVYFELFEHRVATILVGGSAGLPCLAFGNQLWLMLKNAACGRVHKKKKRLMGGGNGGMRVFAEADCHRSAYVVVS